VHTRAHHGASIGDRALIGLCRVHRVCYLATTSQTSYVIEHLSLGFSFGGLVHTQTFANPFEQLLVQYLIFARGGINLP
jgi:hypothetical protein